MSVPDVIPHCVPRCIALPLLAAAAAAPTPMPRPGVARAAAPPPTSLAPPPLLRLHPPQVAITDTFSVLGVGTVVSGIVRSGSVRPNDTVWLGPNGNGQFRPAVVKSLHVQRTLMDRVEAGESACFALKRERRADLRKGMVLVDAKLKRPEAVWEFEAEACSTVILRSMDSPAVHPSQAFA